MENVIEISGLTKTFQRHFWTSKEQVLKGLDLAIQPGEIFGFLGPNGAGKTTTIKAILGIIRPSSGTVSLFGAPPQSTASKARMGYLPEVPYFYDYLSGREFLAFCGRLCGMSGKTLAARIDLLMELAGISHAADLQLRKYSKGMLQRLGLAQALVNDPELVILDEPMTGLDPIGRREFKELILGLRRQGKTVFFSSHILGDAEMLCDRIAIISRGRLLREGKLSELVRARTKAIELVCRRITEAAVERLAAISRSHVRRDGDIQFDLPDEPAVARAVEIVSGSGGEIASIIPQRESLEEYFTREVELDG